MTFIMHISIPAQTAHVLADIVQGEAFPFPPGGANAWKVFSGDGAIDLEIIERGDVIMLRDGEGEAVFERLEHPQRASECHLALCIDRPEAEAIDIARRAGWAARHCERGGGLFGLAEIWVDNSFMIELLDPKESARYRERVTAAKWKQYLPMMLGQRAAS